MTFQLDANILLRLAVPTHHQYAEAFDAVAVLLGRGHNLIVVPQNLYEFWAVATRPVPDNGLGMTPGEAAAELVSIRARFALLPDTPAILPEWERLVAAYRVIGKQTHDARLAAAMLAHGAGNLLTFNAKHFQRFVPTIQVFTPAAVNLTPP